MLLTDAKCRTCGGPVEIAKSSGRPFKYCSNECRANWRHSVVRSPVTVARDIRQCQQCESTYAPVTTKQNFCCTECEYENRKERTRIARRKATWQKPCEACGRIIDRPKPSQKYCCQECRPKQAGHRVYVKDCLGCGKTFSTELWQRRYCGAQCRPDAAAPRAIKECECCGSQFEATPGRRFCTQRCGRKFVRRNSPKKHIERCRVKHRRYEPINPQEIFKRDAWLCGICLAPVDMDAVVPAPLAATLDHIIPLSRGGHHEMGNVRCAHFMCNSIKSGKLDEEINWPAVDHQHQRTS